MCFKEFFSNSDINLRVRSQKLKTQQKKNSSHDRSKRKNCLINNNLNQKRNIPAIN